MYLQLNSSLLAILDSGTVPLTLKANHVGSSQRFFLARIAMQQQLLLKPLLLGPCIPICWGKHNQCQEPETIHNKLFLECSMLC
jgi:hypothetical protein